MPLAVLHVCDREEDVAEGDEPHGHVTSISVLRSYRRLGLAKRLMIQSREYCHCASSSPSPHAPSYLRFLYDMSQYVMLMWYGRSEEAMATVYKAAYVSLHVRKSNRAALGLYRDTLGFTVKDIEKGYCESVCYASALSRTFDKLDVDRCRWGGCICDASFVEASGKVEHTDVSYSGCRE